MPCAVCYSYQSRSRPDRQITSTMTSHEIGQTDDRYSTFQEMSRTERQMAGTVTIDHITGPDTDGQTDRQTDRQTRIWTCRPNARGAQVTRSDPVKEKEDVRVLNSAADVRPKTAFMCWLVWPVGMIVSPLHLFTMQLPPPSYSSHTWQPTTPTRLPCTPHPPPRQKKKKKGREGRQF